MVALSNKQLALLLSCKESKKKKLADLPRRQKVEQKRRTPYHAYSKQFSFQIFNATTPQEMLLKGSERASERERVRAGPLYAIKYFPHDVCTILRVTQVYVYTHIREERTVPDQNNFLCIHQLRLSRFPLLAAYNLLLSTLISIIIPMLFFSVPLRIAGHDGDGGCSLFLSCI